jgi:hypothetical protein
VQELQQAACRGSLPPALEPHAPEPVALRAPARQRVVASLTTTPGRLPHIGPTLRSILAQTHPPEAVYLNIPDVFLRDMQPYVVPEALRREFVGMPVVFNCGVKDQGPATKLLPTLEQVAPDEDVWCAVCDDDILYPRRTLRCLLDAAMAAGGAGVAVSLAAITMHPDGTFTGPSGPGPAHVLEGYAGAIFHRSLFDQDFDAYIATCLADRHCRLSDDIVLSNWCALKGTRKLVAYEASCNWNLLFDRDGVRSIGTGPDALHQGGGGSSNSNIDRYQLAVSRMQELGILAETFDPARHPSPVAIQPPPPPAPADPLAALEAAHVATLARLRAMENSTFWRLSAPLRWVLAAFPAPRRWVRRGLQLMWWTLTLQLPGRLRWHRHALASPAVPETMAETVPEPATLPPETPPLAQLQAIDEVARSGYFDLAWYCQRHPEVPRELVPAITHYLAQPLEPPCDPGPDFDAAWYLASNPDAQGGNPLLHHFHIGKHWHRHANPTEQAAAEARQRRRHAALGLDLPVPILPIAVGLAGDASPAALARMVRSVRIAAMQAGLADRCTIFHAGPGEGLPPDVRAVAAAPSKAATHDLMLQAAAAQGAMLYLAADAVGIFDPECIAALCRMSAAADHAAIIAASDFPEENAQVYDQTSFEIGWAGGGCVLLPVAVANRLRGHDSRLAEYAAVDLSWRARQAGLAVKTCPPALFHTGPRERAEGLTLAALADGLRLARLWGHAPAAAAMRAEILRRGGEVEDEPGDRQGRETRFSEFDCGFGFAPMRW